MKQTRTIVTVLLLAVMSLFTGSAIAAVDQSSNDPVFNSHATGALSVGVGVFAISLAKRYAKTPSWLQWAMPGAHCGHVSVAAIEQELWIDAIISKLFADNTVLQRCRRLDQYVVGGKVLHIPQAGANAGGQKNRTVFPAGVVQRTDTDLTMALDVFTTNPVLLQNAEQAQLSYDKMTDLLQDQIEWLDENVTLEALYAWGGVGGAQIFRTSGADSALNLAPGATGTRKVMSAADVKQAFVMLNKQRVPKKNRVALLESNMMGELMDDPMLKQRDVAKEADYKEGTLIRLYGFDVMERSETCVFNNAGTPVKKAVGAATAVTDNNSSLFYNESSVGIALGEKMFFENKQDPTYYGDIYSALIRAGYVQLRGDGKGVVSLVQAA